jgi:hypothetical protein
LALGKSVQEIRALPNPEYEYWKLFYMLEPFGWGAHHALLYNVHRESKSKAKNEDELLNDRAAEILKGLKAPPDLSGMSIEEKREFMRQQIKKDFGIK